jgi:ATP-dependent RNA/DNA helicase IGHMBP2
MNVAITRAKRFIGLIGDSETVNSDPFLKNLISYFEKNGEVRSAQDYEGDEEIRFG